MSNKKLLPLALIGVMGFGISHQAWSSDPHAGHDHSSMQGGKAPEDARDPHAYSNGLRFNDRDLQRLHLMDQHIYKAFIVDHLERVFDADHEYTAYKLQAWIGRDYNKFALHSEGHIKEGDLNAHTELYWSHAYAAYWDSLLGVRFDHGHKDRQWLAAGVQGLAPYMFEVTAKAFIDSDARVAAKVEVKRELLFTQDLELEPKLEAKAFSSKDQDFNEGAGLADVSAALRLKYHIKPEFAPYIGVKWQQKFGETADMAKANQQSTASTQWVAGISFWF
ncbi:copper resistance protein B [Thiomicrospira aerophila]|nr:copper resistance protein B [Thiomicrospira aerophila]